MENIEYTIQYDIDLVKQFRELLESDSIVALHIIESKEIVSFVAEHVENGQTFYSHWISSSQNWPLVFLDLVVENHFSSSKRPFRLIPFYDIDDSEWEAWVDANPQFRASQYDNFIQIDNDGDQSRSGYTRYASNTESTQQKSQSGAESKTAGSFGSRSAQSEGESIPSTPELRQAKKDLEEMKRDGVFSKSNMLNSAKLNKELMDSLHVSFEDLEEIYYKGETLSKDFLMIPLIDKDSPKTIREMIAEVIIENNQMLEIQLKDKKNISEHIDRECFNVQFTVDMQNKMDRVKQDFPYAISEYQKTINILENQTDMYRENLLDNAVIINELIKKANNYLEKLHKNIKEFSEIILFCKERNEKTETRTHKGESGWSLVNTMKTIYTSITDFFSKIWKVLQDFFPWLTTTITAFWTWIKKGGYGRIICVSIFALIFYFGFAALSLSILKGSYMINPFSGFQVGASILCELVFGIGVPAFTTISATIWQSLPLAAKGLFTVGGISGGIGLFWKNATGGFLDTIIQLAEFGLRNWKPVVGFLLSFGIGMLVQNICSGYKISAPAGTVAADFSEYPMKNLVSNIMNPNLGSTAKYISGDHPSLLPLTMLIKGIKLAFVG